MRIGCRSESVRKMARQALMIFITTENEADLVRRLEKRKTELPIACLAHRHGAQGL